MILLSETQDIVVKKTNGRVTRPRALMLSNQIRASSAFLRLNSQMKSIWKGSVAFGLVNIPVRLYSATESQSLASHMLHKKDLSRIRFQRVAESTGKEVPAEEIVKGYEVEKNQYVILADEELREVAPEKSTGIDIQEFVNEAEISSLYFEKPYYLEPDKGAGKAFALLREALMKTGKVGIAQFVLRNRDSLCMLKPHGQGLVLNAFRFASEIRSMEELSLPSNEKISPSEVSLAIKLIEPDDPVSISVKSGLERTWGS
jgi:DNA end-binding protein Ku